MHDIVLDACAGYRVVSHQSDAEMERRLEEPGHDVGRRGAAADTGTGLGRQNHRKAVEKLPHPR